MPASIHESFLLTFSDMPDPRLDRTRLHDLLDILFGSLCAVLCGADDGTAIEDFCRARVDWLRKYVPLRNGIPSHDTFTRVLSRIDPDRFAACFTTWMNLLYNHTEGQIIAIDGKTLRHSFDEASGKAAIHMVSAWGSANGLVLGQVKVDDKSNEITAVPKLLEILDLKGSIITADAMSTQRAIADKIIKGEGDYVLPVKGNQPELQADLHAFFEHAFADNFLDGDAERLPYTFHETHDTGHGRIDVRRCWACPLTDRITTADRWAGLTSVALLESERTDKGVTTTERRYFISSLSPNAAQIMGAVRMHWGIENSLHWVLDMTFNEDKSRMRKDHEAENMATLRHISLNILKRNKSRNASIRRKRMMAAWEPEFLTELLQN
jgi:predicted transposase YbfD/YdcC